MGACPLCAAEPRPFATDSLGGTLARDHQSRAMYFHGTHRRTYVTYMDHAFNARITFYDHDTEAWAAPVVVDDCIAEVGWAKGLKDGHNAPNLWVSKSGTIHLIYGSHGTPFKYARSAEPECIQRWELGTRISNYATYPFLTELPGGAILMFYRYGPTGGYKNPFLAVQQTADEGRTWRDVKKIAALRNACKLNGYNALYDATSRRIYLNVALKPHGSWASFCCQYDPAAGRLYSWNGTTFLGALPGDDAFVAHCRVEGRTLREIFVHDGVLYMLLKGKNGTLSFARWDGKRLRKHDIPAEKTAGYLRGPIWTTDGTVIRLYGMRTVITRKPPPHGADVYVWTSTDGGTTWDSGKPVVRQEKLGVRLQEVNRVMHYAGSGPFLILAEATGQLPKDFQVTPANHYDNPWRKNKRLYALDEQGRFLSGPGS
jgi:hypothetical protein